MQIKVVGILLAISLNSGVACARPDDPRRLAEYEEHELNRLRDIPNAINPRFNASWVTQFPGFLVTDGMNLGASVVYKNLISAEKLPPTELAEALRFFARIADVDECDAICVKYSLSPPAAQGVAADCARAVRAIKGGKTREAEVALQAVLKVNVHPSDQDGLSALNSLAKAYIAANQSDTAIRILSKALAKQSTSELNWSHVELLGEYYNALKALGRNTEAQDVLRRLDTTMITAERFVKADRIASHDVLMRDLAMLFQENGAAATSVAILRQAAPEPARPWLLVETDIANGKFDKAHKLIIEQLDSPRMQRSLMTHIPEIATQYIRAGHDDDAIAVLVYSLKRANYIMNLAVDPTGPIALQLGELLEARLEVPESKRLFRKQTGFVYPVASVMRETIFDMLVQADKPAEAIALATLRTSGTKYDRTEHWTMLDRAIDVFDRTPSLDTEPTWKELAKAVPPFGIANYDLQIRVCERLLHRGAKYSGDKELMQALQRRLENAKANLQSQLR